MKKGDVVRAVKTCYNEYNKADINEEGIIKKVVQHIDENGKAMTFFVIKFPHFWEYFVVDSSYIELIHSKEN